MQVIDLRPELPRNPDGGPGRRIDAADKTGLVVHYNGPAVPSTVNDVDWIRRIVAYHLAKNWNPGGQHVAGDGVMYHRAVGRDGRVYRMRDDGEVLWHSGAWPENETHLSVYVILGGDQRATPRQLTALHDLVDEWLRSGSGRTRDRVIGHQEVDWTECPGTLMEDFVLPYRGVLEMTTEGRWFPETGCFVGGAFWDYWRNNGGLMLFGFPLTDELEEHGLTVQYFERCVMEWHPDNPVGYRVLLRRLGADALSV